MSNLVLSFLKLCNQPTETGLNWPREFLQDFKVCDWPLRLVSGGQSPTLKSTRPSWTFEPRPKWPILNFKIPSAIWGRRPFGTFTRWCCIHSLHGWQGRSYLVSLSVKDEMRWVNIQYSNFVICMLKVVIFWTFSPKSTASVVEWKNVSQLLKKRKMCAFPFPICFSKFSLFSLSFKSSEFACQRFNY